MQIDLIQVFIDTMNVTDLDSLIWGIALLVAVFWAAAEIIKTLIRAARLLSRMS